MRKTEYLVWPLLFGSLWGMSEVVIGDALYTAQVPWASTLLSVWALFLLATARGFLNKPGSSTAAGCIAVLFRLVNTTPFFCHLLGIFFLGLAFDAAATLLKRSKRPSPLWNSLTGIISAYAGYALFALTTTYIIRYDFWAAAGLPKVLDHIFINGSVVALAASFTVPLGYAAGSRGELLTRRYPAWTLGISLLIAAVTWVLV